MKKLIINATRFWIIFFSINCSEFMLKQEQGFYFACLVLDVKKAALSLDSDRPKNRLQLRSRANNGG